jgi:L-lactate utilization protein LutC
MTNWTTLATPEVVTTTMENLQRRGMTALHVASKAEALAQIEQLIPEGKSVMTGSSTTLNQIGFAELVKANPHHWTDVHAQINAEPDETKRHQLRRLSVTSEYFLASPNAVTQEGQLVIVDRTGSRTGAMPSAAEHLILVVGTQKITPNLETAMQRIREYVFDLEDKRSLAAYGTHTDFGKWVIIEKEITPNRITVIFIDEALGF